eukprot:m.131052 g.131052  ORF g.131052 m.131052 type:complete len:192 (-) comp14612_c0_seq35:717-1292(-)
MVTLFMSRYRRETLQLSDGGTVALDWLCKQDDSTSENEEESQHEAVVIIQHGMAGSSESAYIKHFIRYLSKRRPRWHIVVMLARGCGGTKLTSPNGFTAARISDFAETVGHVRRQIKHTPIFAIGYSLGAGILGKYLGTYGTNTGLDGACMLSPSWDYNIQGRSFPFWSRAYLVQGSALIIDMLTHRSPNV